MTLALILLAIGTAPDADTLFRRGVEARSDARAARSHFAAAAAAYDHEANADPSVSLRRRQARAHALAGNTPKALAVLHDALRRTPADRELHRDLEAVRDTVSYPTPSAPDARLRPPSPAGLRHRFAPDTLLFIGVGFVGLAAVGLAARFTTRPGWSGPLTGFGLGGFVLTAGLAAAVELSRVWADDRVRVVSADRVTLRRGNGESYPARVSEKLPRGAEVSELGRRGGWVQVELAGGAVGWLPETAILR